MRPLAILVSATFLVLVITPAYADTVEVTFTGTVTFVFQPVDPVVAGVSVGDPVTSVLFYNQNQPDLNPAPPLLRGLAVHTASGDVTVPGSTIAPNLILRNRRAHPHTVLENPGLFLSVPCTGGKT